MKVRNSAIFLGVLLCAAFVLFGCTGTPICGDNLCSAGEENSCPTDCAKTINGSIIVNVSGAYDAEGSLSLEYYTSNNVNYNFNNTINSYLASNWSGSTQKNLSISLNQSQSVVKPIPQYGDRTIVITNPKQGEYFFTARSDDYAYFGNSEKILVDKDQNYYVNVELKASQPVARVIAVDNADSSYLVGPGTIEIHLITEVYKNGEYSTTDQLVNSMTFTENEKMNGLFYLFQPEQGIDFSSRFVAVITKEGYSSASQNLYWTTEKYSEYTVPLMSKTAQKGTLQVTLVPGKGTTTADLQRLVGKQFNIQGFKGVSYPATLSSDLTLVYNNLYLGGYSFGVYDSPDHNTVPLSGDKYIEFSSDGQIEKVEVFRGSELRITAVDSVGNIIDPTQIVVKRLCMISNDGNGTTNCYDYNNTTWAKIWANNPIESSQTVYSEVDLDNRSNQQISFYLSFNGMDKTFNFPYFVQGFNIQNLVFDSNTSTQLCVNPTKDTNSIVYKVPTSCVVKGSLGVNALAMVKVDKNAQIVISNPNPGMILQFYSGGWHSYQFDPDDLVWNEPLPWVNTNQGLIIQNAGTSGVTLNLVQ